MNESNKEQNINHSATTSEQQDLLTEERIRFRASIVAPFEPQQGMELKPNNPSSSLTFRITAVEKSEPIEGSQTKSEVTLMCSSTIKVTFGKCYILQHATTGQAIKVYPINENQQTDAATSQSDIQTYRYMTQGVCSKLMDIEMDRQTHVIRSVKILGGCPGNLLGISRIVEGMRAEDVISRLSGTTCGPKATSCPDQLAQALRIMIGK